MTTNSRWRWPWVRRSRLDAVEAEREDLRERLVDALLKLADARHDLDRLTRSGMTALQRWRILDRVKES